MTDLLRDLFQIICAFLSHWQVYMTGGIVMAVLFVYERLANTTVSVRVVIGGVMAFILVAFFMAWRDERHGKIDGEKALLERHTPNLRGNIDQVAMGFPSDRPDNTLAVLTLSIRNVGMPSIVEGYSVSVDIPKIGKVPGHVYHMPQPMTLQREDRSPAVFDNNNEIYGKTVQPIVTGDREQGLLFFVLEGVPKHVAYQAGTVITVTYLDVLGKPYDISYTLRNVSEEPKYFPGVDSSPSRR